MDLNDPLTSALEADEKRRILSDRRRTFAAQLFELQLNRSELDAVPVSDEAKAREREGLDTQIAITAARVKHTAQLLTELDS